MGSAAFLLGPLVQFEAIPRNGGVNFLGIPIDATIDPKSVFETMAPEPSTMIEDAAALMVDENDFPALI